MKKEDKKEPEVKPIVKGSPEYKWLGTGFLRLAVELLKKREKEVMQVEDGYPLPIIKSKDEDK